MGIKGFGKRARGLFIQGQQVKIYKEQVVIKEEKTRVVRQETIKVKIRLQKYG